MKQESWRNLGGESIEEATGRYLGGVSEVLDVSGRHLGGISEASGRLRWPRGVLEVKIVESGTLLQQNANFPLYF